MQRRRRTTRRKVRDGESEPSAAFNNPCWLSWLENDFEAISQTLGPRGRSPTGPYPKGESLAPIVCRGRGVASRSVPAAEACRTTTLRSMVKQAPTQHRCVESCPTYRRAWSRIGYMLGQSLFMQRKTRSGE
jgi:hypothetical protein